MKSNDNDQNKDKYCVVIDAAHDGQRLDNYLIAHYKGVPKSRLYRACRKGEVRINKKRVKPSDRVISGDHVRLPPLKTKEVSQPLPKNIDKTLDWLKASVLYEDAGLLVLNKPAGLAVHGGTGVGVSLMPLLQVLYPNQYLRLVHRIDRATSGCLLIAKSRIVLLSLQEQFRDHSVQKEYHALCFGKMKDAKKHMLTPLLKERDGETGVKMVIDAKGKEAESTIYRMHVGKALTHVKVHIKTGRMHQIRVHCAELSLPLLGDVKYGDKVVNALMQKHGINRMFLHAHHVSITYADKQHNFFAPLPDSFEKIETYDQWLVNLDRSNR